MAYIITEKVTGKVAYITETAPTETLPDYKVFQHDSLRPGDEIGYEIHVTFDDSGQFLYLSTVKLGMTQQEINKRLSEKDMEIVQLKKGQALMQVALDELIFGGGM